jgi:hypothetical protein
MGRTACEAPDARLAGMDQGRESRWDKDAMTVEIVFALVTAAVTAAAVIAAALGLGWALDLSDTARHRAGEGGAVLGAAAGVWRLVRVLRRFDAGRRRSH